MIIKEKHCRNGKKITAAQNGFIPTTMLTDTHLSTTDTKLYALPDSLQREKNIVRYYNAHVILRLNNLTKLTFYAMYNKIFLLCKVKLNPYILMHFCSLPNTRDN